MNDPIEMMVEHLFRNCADTEEVRTAREEITNNCQEHFRDLVAGGMNEGDALEAITESLCGMEELVKSYPQKADQIPEEAFAKDQPAPDGCMSFAAQDVHTLDMSIGNHDVTLCPSRDGMYHVIYEDEETAGSMDVQCQNGSLFLRTGLKKELGDDMRGFAEAASRIRDLDDVSGFLRKVGGLVQGAFKRTMSSMDDGRITIEVPGSVPALKVTGIGGDVNLQELNLASMKLRSVSGDIHISRAGVRESVQVNTTSGDVQVELAAGGSVELCAISGDVEVQTVCGGKLTLRTTSGDVDGTVVCQEAEAHSVSGDVELSFTDNRLRKLDVHTVSGDVQVALPADLRADMHTVTKSGSVHCSHNGTGMAGIVRLNINTVSGGIHVD